MDAKTSEWRAGPNVCRCCLTEGCYKDISTEYFWMGKREVYAEMLADTLNVTIAYSQSGGPNSNSRLICELCISRLRDASDFRRQVLECEKTFTQHLDAGASNITAFDVQIEAADSDVKLEHVKQEKRLSDDDFDDRCGFDDDDDDDLDDQPLTKLASKIPKKESVDILDLLDNSKATEKRKSSTKTKSVPAKKSKTVKKEPVKATASKVVAKTDKKKKEYDPLVEARQNAKQILKYSTAYPFRLQISQMMCVCCRQCFEDPELFRRHMRLDHRANVLSFTHSLGLREYLKADCTDLGCKICAKRFDDLKTIAEHLSSVHHKKINFNFDFGIQSFKLGREKWVCASCNKKFPCLRSLSRHNSSHYHKYTCESCGRSYISRDSLRSHVLLSHSQEKICVKCKESFASKEELREHKLSNARCWPYICSLCNTRFLYVRLKTQHLSEVHGVDDAKKVHKCPLCFECFQDNKSYRSHYVSAHTDTTYDCQFCGLQFLNASALSSHKVIHTTGKNYQCTGCPKSFTRIKNLRQHMWIHSEHKRFKCDPCNKQFNQRVSWKTHMKSHHPELVDF